MAGEVCASGFFSTSAAFSTFLPSSVAPAVDCATSGLTFVSVDLLEFDWLLFFREASSEMMSFSGVFLSVAFIADVSFVSVF